MEYIHTLFLYLSYKWKYLHSIWLKLKIFLSFLFWIFLDHCVVHIDCGKDLSELGHDELLAEWGHCGVQCPSEGHLGTGLGIDLVEGN